jgi:hypothetical protein
VLEEICAAASDCWPHLAAGVLFGHWVRPGAEVVIAGWSGSCAEVSDSRDDHAYEYRHGTHVARGDGSASAFETELGRWQSEVADAGGVYEETNAPLMTQESPASLMSDTLILVLESGAAWRPQLWLVSPRWRIWFRGRYRRKPVAIHLAAQPGRR